MKKGDQWFDTEKKLIAESVDTTEYRVYGESQNTWELEDDF